MAGNVIQGNFPNTGGAGGPSLPPPPSSAANSTASMTRYAIWQIRHDKQTNRTTDAVTRAIFNRIWDQELQQEKGNFIVSLPEKRCYLLTGISHQLYEISPQNEDFTSYIWFKYGLLKTETLTKHVIAALAAYCRMRGVLREVRRFACYDCATQTLYISRYNGTAWKINGSGCLDIVPNGTGSALFIDDDDGVTVREPIIADHRLLIPRLVDGISYVESTAGGMTPDQQRLAMAIWVFTLAFPDFLPSKPIMLVEGERGSGKTSAMQLVQRALHGAKRKTHAVGKDDQHDFPVKLLRSPICIIDNVDSFVNWLQDDIARYVTGAGWSKRRLYTDDGEAKVNPQSFIAITSRNPLTFKRDDVADRCIIFRLRRREEYRPMSRLEREIDDERPEIFGEWLFILDRIIAEIRSGSLEARMSSSTHRMADFAALSHVIGKVMGVGEDEVEAMLEGMQAERDALIAEGDPLIEFLDRWLENVNNVGRPISANDLFKELAESAKQNNRTFYKSPSTLAQKLRSQAVQKLYEVRDGGMRGNIKLYEIRRQSNK